jgi:hypothetical protein
MINKLIGPALVGLLIASAVFNLWASVRTFFTLREIYKLQAWTQHIRTTLSASQSLAADAVEYSKTHPAIDPVLQQIGIKAKPTTTPTPPAQPTPGTRSPR